MEEKETHEAKKVAEEVEEEIVENVNTDGKGKISFPKTGIIIISVIIVLMIVCIIVIMANGGPVK